MVGDRNVRRLFTARGQSAKRGLMAAVLAAAVVAVAGMPKPVAAAEFRLLKLDGVFVKWGAAQFGTGATVTWALQQGERHQPDAINCQDTTSLDGLLGRAGVSSEVFHTQVVKAFAMWQSRSDLTFVEAAPGEKADIVIGAELTPRGIAWTNVDYQRPPMDTPPLMVSAASQTVPAAPQGEPAIATLTQAAICLNPEMSWHVGPGASLTTYDLRLVLAHEIGHAIGLDHPGREGQLMGFAYQNNLTDLMTGDVSGVVRLYGAKPTHPVETD
jgi:hypothetical protein